MGAPMMPSPMNPTRSPMRELRLDGGVGDLERARR